MNNYTAAFIGAGNMSGAIIGGLLAAGFDPARLRASAPSQNTRDKYQALGLSAVGSDNTLAAEGADVLILGVKPYVIEGVCRELAPTLSPDQLVVSLAAGVSADSLSTWLQGKGSLVRCMSNTPALLGYGASALFALGNVRAEQRQRVEEIMQAVGLVRWVDNEALLHAVTAISGSGPAYFFQFMEAMIAEGVRMGLDADTARTLCAQTCIGAGRMIAEGQYSAAELRQRVCSPGGTTERAVAAFSAAGLEEIVATAMRDCYARSVEMGKELG